MYKLVIAVDNSWINNERPLTAKVSERSELHATKSTDIVRECVRLGKFMIIMHDIETCCTHSKMRAGMFFNSFILEEEWDYKSWREKIDLLQPTVWKYVVI